MKTGMYLAMLRPTAGGMITTCLGEVSNLSVPRRMPGRSINTGNPQDDVKFTGYELDDEGGLNLYHAMREGMIR